MPTPLNIKGILILRTFDQDALRTSTLTFPDAEAFAGAGAPRCCDLSLSDSKWSAAHA